MEDIKGLRLLSDNYSKRYQLYKVFNNGVNLLWETFVTKRSALRRSIQLSKKYQVELIVDLRGEHHGKEIC